MNRFLSRATLALLLPAALLASACDSTDDDPDGEVQLGLYATSNPADLASDGVVRLTPDLTSTPATFSGLTGATSIQSVAFDGSGNAFLTVDLAGALGGIVYVSGLCTNASDGCTNAGTTLSAGTRTVAGVATGLVAPKGLVVAGNRVVVADNGSNSIRVFSATASGNVAPEFVVTDLGSGTNVWDVAVDGARLYVAATNGLVLVYDDFFTTRGTDGPSRTITPTDDGDQISVNLHGIVYDDARDLLVLSDVGSASDATDGQLFTIASASAATGSTAVRARVSGSASRLGNPVDLALTSGGVVYVAEKSNDLVLRYDGLLTASGALTAAADASITVVKPESVALANQ